MNRTYNVPGFYRKRIACLYTACCCVTGQMLEEYNGSGKFLEMVPIHRIHRSDTQYLVFFSATLLVFFVIHIALAFFTNKLHVEV